MIDDIDDLDLVNTVSMQKWYLKFRRFSLLYCRIIYNGVCPFYGQETSATLLGDLVGCRLTDRCLTPKSNGSYWFIIFPYKNDENCSFWAIPHVHCRTHV